jgi:hypothetical protein
MDAIGAKHLLYQKLAIHENAVKSLEDKSLQNKRRIYWDEHVRATANELEDKHGISLLRLFFHPSVSNPNIQVVTLAAAWVSLLNEAPEDLKRIMLAVMRVLGHIDLPEDPTSELIELFSCSSMTLERFQAMIHSFKQVAQKDKWLKRKIHDAKHSKLSKEQRLNAKKRCCRMIETALENQRTLEEGGEAEGEQRPRKKHRQKLA